MPSPLAAVVLAALCVVGRCGVSGPGPMVAAPQSEVAGLSLGSESAEMKSTLHAELGHEAAGTSTSEDDQAREDLLQVLDDTVEPTTRTLSGMWDKILNKVRGNAKAAEEKRTSVSSSLADFYHGDASFAPATRVSVWDTLRARPAMTEGPQVAAANLLGWSRRSKVQGVNLIQLSARLSVNEAPELEAVDDEL